MREAIPGALAGERIDRAVSMLTGQSRSVAESLVAAGAVLVDGEVVSSRSRRLSEGEVLEIHLEAAGPQVAELEPEAGVDVVVVHQDEHLLVVDKPAGLVVHPGGGRTSGTLVGGLLARFPEIAGVGSDPRRPGIVHRLDRDTSGLMVVARTPESYSALVQALAAREVDRSYTALAWGRFESPSGLVDAPVGRSSRRRDRMGVVGSGRPARTRYEVVDTFSDPVEVTLLNCTLETGRTHQIRVHLQAIEHPVVGDEWYGGVRESFEAPRLFLHARRLAFTHPFTGERVELDSPLPADLARTLGDLT